MTTDAVDSDEPKADDATRAFRKKARAFSTLTAELWVASPWRALNAVLSCGEALAVQCIRRFPSSRARVLDWLAAMRGNVKRETTLASGVTH